MDAYREIVGTAHCNGCLAAEVILQVLEAPGGKESA
jgi:hypothetical protein